ncbi:MAG: hypothetical protein K2Q09_03090, partial [Phycisphaerales bacterium]|nr:hypothetical protein [Phycisphaerales bacterium]
WPGGPVVEVRGPSRGPGPQGGGRVPAPQAARRGAGAQPGRVGPGGKPARQQKQSKKRARVEPPPVQRAIYEEPLRRDRMVEVEVERVVEPVRMALRSTRDQWRAAVIAAEVLGAPVSLRGPGGGQ